jgi:NADH:ubiquinone oxidoreductase subunit C
VIETEILGPEWGDRARELRGEGWQLAGLSGLDRLHLGFEHRFGVVAHLLHHERKEWQSLHVAATGEPPTVPSVTPIWPTANFFEREIFDLFGVHFEGHPNLTRILMPEEWEGHPLRKDYGVGKVPIDFLEQPLLQIHSPGQSPRSTEAQQKTDEYGQSERAQRRSDQG